MGAITFIIRSPSQCSSYLIRPRLLRDVAHRDLSVSIIDNSVQLSFPIGIASTACQRMAHDDGELATARGWTRTFRVIDDSNLDLLQALHVFTRS